MTRLLPAWIMLLSALSSAVVGIGSGMVHVKAAYDRRDVVVDEVGQSHSRTRRQSRRLQMRGGELVSTAGERPMEATEKHSRKTEQNHKRQLRVAEGGLNAARGIVGSASSPNGSPIPLLGKDRGFEGYPSENHLLGLAAHQFSLAGSLQGAKTCRDLASARCPEVENLDGWGGRKSAPSDGVAPVGPIRVPAILPSTERLDGRDFCGMLPKGWTGPVRSCTLTCNGKPCDSVPLTERRRLIPPADIQTSPKKLSAVKLGTVQDIKEAAGLCGVDPSLYTRLVARESNFDPNAISWAGAVGLAQVKPSTARELSRTLDVVNRPFDNLLAGACLLRQHYDRTGSWREALHDYNAGRWRKVTTQATRDYAETILGGETR